MSPTPDPSCIRSNPTAGRQRVFAREPNGRGFGYGTVTHVQTWNGIALCYTVALDTGAVLRVPPAWLVQDLIQLPTGNVVPLRPQPTAGWPPNLFRDADGVA